jgi:hypothetical protein
MLPYLFLADASFSSGGGSSAPLVVGVIVLGALGLGWMAMQAAVATSVTREVFREQADAAKPRPDEADLGDEI